jgi:hypothetical protein
MEEIYQAKECPDDKYAHPIPIPNPHKAYKEGTRYYFNFPEAWFNMPTLNKAVAVRRITSRPRAYDFKIDFYIWRRATGTASWTENLLINTLIHVRPTEDIETAMSNIVLTINREIRKQITNHPTYLFPEDWVNIRYDFNEDDRAASMSWFSDREEGTRTHEFMIRVNTIDEDFGYLFNRENFGWNQLDISLNGEVDAWAWFEYPNVWDRRELFIHASFVTYTSFQYLGRTGEFYTKPSKIYDFHDSSSRLFYFQVSFDGMNIVNLFYENFIVELSLILDSRRYQSE